MALGLCAAGDAYTLAEKKMTINEVKEILNENNIDKQRCPINTLPFAEGALHLNRQDDGSWIVLLNERGNNNIYEVFISESDACRAFVTHVLCDPTYRKDFKQSDLIYWKEKVGEILRKYNLI